MLRRLLVGSAHYILGPFGSDSDLRRHGQKITSRGGKNAKKRAVVAVARRLAAVLLHCLWLSAELYEPLGNTQRSGGQAALKKKHDEEEVKTTGTLAALKWRRENGFFCPT